MRTTLKIETPTKALEVTLKLVDGKQMVELELADLLSLIEGKSGKAPSTVKASNPPKASKAAKAPKEIAAAPKVGAKRGRKPKAAIQTGHTANAVETVADPTV